MKGSGDFYNIIQPTSSTIPASELPSNETSFRFSKLRLAGIIFKLSLVYADAGEMSVFGSFFQKAIHHGRALACFRGGIVRCAVGVGADET